MDAKSPEYQKRDAAQRAADRAERAARRAQAATEPADIARSRATELAAKVAPAHADEPLAAEWSVPVTAPATPAKGKK